MKLRTLPTQNKAMSARPPKSDIGVGPKHYRYGPRADLRPSRRLMTKQLFAFSADERHMPARQNLWRAACGLLSLEVRPSVAPLRRARDRKIGKWEDDAA